MGERRSFGFGFVLDCSVSRLVAWPTANDAPEGEMAWNRDEVGDVFKFKPTSLLAYVGGSLDLTPPPRFSYRSTISEIDPRRGDARGRGTSGALKSEVGSIGGFGGNMNIDCGRGLSLRSVTDEAGDALFTGR